MSKLIELGQSLLHRNPDTAPISREEALLRYTIYQELKSLGHARHEKSEYDFIKVNLKHLSGLVIHTPGKEQYYTERAHNVAVNLIGLHSRLSRDAHVYIYSEYGQGEGSIGLKNTFTERPESSIWISYFDRQQGPVPRLSFLQNDPVQHSLYMEFYNLPRVEKYQVMLMFAHAAAVAAINS